MPPCAWERPCRRALMHHASSRPTRRYTASRSRQALLGRHSSGSRSLTPRLRRRTSARTRRGRLRRLRDSTDDEMSQREGGPVRPAAEADALAIGDRIAAYRSEHPGGGAIDRAPIRAAVSSALADVASTVLVATAD